MIIMAVTDINTVLMSQRMAAGTVGPVENTIWVLSWVNHSLRGTCSSHRGALRLLNSSLKLRMTHSEGHHWGTLLVMAVGVLKEPVIIQYSGNRKMTAAIMAIRIMVTV